MSFRGAIQKAHDAVKNRSTLVQPTRWQSMDVSKVKAATTHEVLNYTLQAQVLTEDLEVLAAEIEPNLPWADDHFLERVGGKPLNPGVEWAHWPWANKADTFRRVTVPDQTELGFDHSYMERYWPKYAGLAGEGQDATNTPHYGIRFKYGDAADIVDHLAKAPDSRQAYLPVWFPEDTGKLDVRVPCTLGYHFIQRGGYLHCTYYIRSCDLYRHFRDDVYLTVRLQLWLLEKLQEASDDWIDVKPGMFTMHIVSLHCFVNDFQVLFGPGSGLSQPLVGRILKRRR